MAELVARIDRKAFHHPLESFLASKADATNNSLSSLCDSTTRRTLGIRKCRVYAIRVSMDELPVDA